jgi:hypothetical protein
MNRLWNPISLALTVVVLGQSVVLAAEEPPQRVPFKATMTGEYRGLVIPLPAPMVSEQLTCKGQADLLGPVTSIEHYFVRFDVAGKLASVTDGIGVLTGANGDALFISYSGLAAGQVAPGEFGRQELAFTITGGQGRFAGATGSGVIKDALFFKDNAFSVTRTLEGVVSAPKS